jgi:hypothetical protein
MINVGDDGEIAEVVGGHGWGVRAAEAAVFASNRELPQAPGLFRVAISNNFGEIRADFRIPGRVGVACDVGSGPRSALRPMKAPQDVSAPPVDAVTEASGLSSRVIAAGSGTGTPGAADTVTVHYSGWTTDGKLFDSSVKRGQPASFPLSGVIKGWTEGLQLMVEGEKRRFWIPEDLAYGKGGGGRPGGMLVFDVELLKIS